MSLTLLDRGTLAYVGVASVFLALRWAALPRGHIVLVLLHLVTAGTALLAPRLRRGGAVGRFVGEFYPLLLLYPLYAELGALNAVAPTFHDARVQAWEALLFGGQPSSEIHEDGFAPASRRTDLDVHALPGAIHLRLQGRKRKRKVAIAGRGDVRHAAAEA